MRRGHDTDRNACIGADTSPCDCHNLGCGTDEVSDALQMMIVIWLHVSSHFAPRERRTAAGGQGYRVCEQGKVTVGSTGVAS